MSGLLKPKPPVVLIVEDEKLIRRFVRTSLEEEGCRVFEAGTCADGLLEAGANKPDLIVLDLGLPDGNGVDFIRDLRAWSDVPILVLSARSNEKDKIQALDVGADDAVRGEIDERLIDEVQAFDREGETQLAEQVHPLARGRLRPRQHLLR